MQLGEVKHKPRNHSLSGFKNSIPTEVRESIRGRDSVTKIRINESVQLKDRRKLYRPSTGSKKRQAIETPTQPQTSRVLKSNQNIIRRILTSGKHLRDYMESHKLPQEQVSQILQDPLVVIQVQMFMSVNNLLEGESETYKQIQAFLLDKIKAKYKFIKQVRTCEKIESKIESMISQRMKLLNKL